MSVLNATDQTITSILKANKLVLIDFWRPYCSPCKMMLPILEEMAQEKGRKGKIVKINVDENPKIASKLGIMAVPTFVVFKKGKPVIKKVGYQSKEELVSLLRKYV